MRRSTMKTFTLQQSALPLSIILAMSLTACGMQQTREQTLKQQEAEQKQEQKQEQNLISEVKQPNKEQNQETVNQETINKKTVKQAEKEIKNKGIKLVEAEVQSDVKSSDKTANKTVNKTANQDKNKPSTDKTSDKNTTTGNTDGSANGSKKEVKTNTPKQADPANVIAKPMTQQRTTAQNLDNKQANQINQNTTLQSKQINKVVNVKVIPAKLVTVPQVKKYTGTTTAFETRQVQPNANGTVGEIYFKQGNWIKAGAPLYRVDPVKDAKQSISTTKATYKQAKADLAAARAANKHAKALLKTNQALLVHAQDDLDRYQRLIVDKAISQQTYNQAFNEVQTAKSAIKSTKSLINQTAADIKKAKANVELVKSYMNDEQSQLKPQMVKAPLTGVVVESHIVKGQKVNSKQTDAFVTIATVNPIFVDVQPTTDEFLAIQKAIRQNKKKPKANKVKLIFNDGKVYASSGAFKFTETTVDENKQVTMKALFDNPKGQLLPNMQVTVELPMPKLVDVVLIPPTAIQNAILVNTANTADNTVSENSKRQSATKANITADSKPAKDSSKKELATKKELAKNAKKQIEQSTSAGIQTNKQTNKQTNHQQVKAIANFVYVVDKDNRVQARKVTINADNNYHGRLIVEKGLKQGDKIIVDSDDVILPRQLVAIKTHEKNKANDKTDSQATKANIATLKDNKAVANKKVSDKETGKQASKQQVINNSHQLKLYPWQLMEMVSVKETVKQK